MRQQMDRMLNLDFAEYANEAAAAERKSDMSALRNGSDAIVFDWNYEPTIECNDSFHIVNDVTLLVDHSKAQWLKQKNNENIDLFDFEKRQVSAARFNLSIEKIQRTALKIDQFAHNLSHQIKRPVILVFNARGATIYSLIYKELYKKCVTKKMLHEWYDKSLKSIESGTKESAVFPFADIKISSKKYVQTPQEAHMIPGYEQINRLKPSYSDVDNEYVSDVFTEILRSKMSLVFVDVPSWGSAYASSTGLMRKQADIEQRKKGIFSPYKMRSYLEYSGYQIHAISRTKTKANIAIPDESDSGFDFSVPIGIVLNPETETDIWWDNCPQILGNYGAKFSEVVHHKLQEPVVVTTSHGDKDLFMYITEKMGMIEV